MQRHACGRVGDRKCSRACCRRIHARERAAHLCMREQQATAHHHDRHFELHRMRRRTLRDGPRRARQPEQKGMHAADVNARMMIREELCTARAKGVSEVLTVGEADV